VRSSEWPLKNVKPRARKVASPRPSLSAAGAPPLDVLYARCLERTG